MSKVTYVSIQTLPHSSSIKTQYYGEYRGSKFVQRDCPKTNATYTLTTNQKYQDKQVTCEVSSTARVAGVQSTSNLPKYNSSIDNTAHSVDRSQ